MRLKVVQQEMPWYADGLRFECTECGNCCTGGPGYVWISDEEIGRLARHLGLSREETIERYCRRIGDRHSLQERRNSRGEYDCIFLRELPAENTSPDEVAHRRRVCAIYEARPLQCRTWPFWAGNLATETNWRRAGVRCPGIGRGRVHTREEMEELRDAGDWPE